MVPYDYLALAIHLVVAADIKQDDFLVRNQEGQRNAVAVGKADGVTTAEFAAQGMQFQVGLKGILLQVVDHRGKT